MERFVQALDRLETATRRRLQGERQPGQASREVQALRDDRSRMAAELDTVKSNYAALEALTHEVETRVDGAITDIRRVLGS